MAEQLANNAVTTLSAGIDGTVTSIPVASSAIPFPQVGNFRLKVDNELMIATAVPDSTHFTCSRGQESTTAVSHLSGAEVKCVLTKASLQALFTDFLAAAQTVGGQWSFTLNPSFPALTQLPEKANSGSANLNSATGHMGGVVRMFAASAMTYTIQPDQVPVGSFVYVLRRRLATAPGTLTITAGAGVTLYSPNGVYTVGNNNGLALCWQVATNEWIVNGDLG